MSWEYRKIALNDRSRRKDDIDVLCEAGEDEWELVAILPNNVAYFKRCREEASGDDTIGGGDEIQERSYVVKAKYRDPATGETWSGRGRMAS